MKSNFFLLLSFIIATFLPFMNSIRTNFQNKLLQFTTQCFEHFVFKSKGAYLCSALEMTGYILLFYLKLLLYHCLLSFFNVYTMISSWNACHEFEGTSE